MKNKVKLLGIILIILIVIIISFTYISNFKEEKCVSKNGNKMRLSTAKQIAENSECSAEGKITETPYCNSETGTWWFGIDAEIPEYCFGVSCVVNVETKTAEVQWMCGGAIPEPN
ncbi:hypothetical protein J4481_02730 [Candidatus Pacearchaeota archaeon]|nr:hypothetical protein [Candidatus Pacearchaeota archaeon]